MGFTGGQYSLIRIVTGLALLFTQISMFKGDGPGFRPLDTLAPQIPDALYAAIGCLLATALLVGRFDRIAAWLLFFVLPWREPTELIALSSAHVLLGLHLLVPSAPFGSLTAVGRNDPGGEWRMPQAMPAIARWYLVVTVLTAAAVWVIDAPPPALTSPYGIAWLLGAAALFSMIPNKRWIGWLLMLVAILVFDALDIGDPFLVLILLYAFLPRWIPPRHQDRPEELLLFDGYCGLCHRAVRFVLAEDQFDRFKLTPLQGDTIGERLTDEQRQNLPDSVVIVTGEDKILVKSRAALYLLNQLGGWWRALAALGGIMPYPISDVIYDAIARVRHRLFPQPKDVCPLMPPSMRARFLP